MNEEQQQAWKNFWRIASEILGVPSLDAPTKEKTPQQLRWIAAVSTLQENGPLSAVEIYALIEIMTETASLAKKRGEEDAYLTNLEGEME